MLAILPTYFNHVNTWLADNLPEYLQDVYGFWRTSYACNRLEEGYYIEFKLINEEFFRRQFFIGHM
jgi:hypothetical protein